MARSRRKAAYTEVRELGTGATGRVVLAVRDSAPSQEPVALKYLARPLMADKRQREQFRRVVNVMAAVEDPHVVRVLGLVESREGSALAMEAMTGPSLRRLLAARGRCSPEVALVVLRGMLAGLAAMHSRRIVHGDVKPGNVFVDVDGTAKVSDFLVAAPVGFGVPAMGTAPYLAPELWTGWPSTVASDIYAAAVVFFEALTGRQPFWARNMAQLRVLHEAAAPPVGALPAAVRPLVAKGMAKLPVLRYTDAGTFLWHVEQVAESGFGGGWWERGVGELAGIVAGMVAIDTVPAKSGHEVALVFGDESGTRPALDGEAAGLTFAADPERDTKVVEPEPESEPEQAAYPEANTDRKA